MWKVAMSMSSIDPELMMRMLIVGYCMGIRSERRLCDEIHLNLAYRWFCRLGLDGKVPDHSTFSRNRHGRFRQSYILRRLFEMVVDRCLREGLVGGEGFAVDASLIAADANKQRSIPGDQWRINGLDANAGQAVRDYLATLDNAAFGAASEVTPKFISPSDPAAQWTGAHKGHAFFAYATNYLIDTENAIILDVEASRAIRQAEVRTMIDRTARRFGLRPRHLAADSAYGSAANLAWLVKKRQIEPHIPVFDKSNRTDGTFSRSDFVFNAERNDYTCPQGKLLVQFRRTYATPRSGITKDGTAPLEVSPTLWGSRDEPPASASLLVRHFGARIVSPHGSLKLSGLNLLALCPFNEVGRAIRWIGMPPLEHADVDRLINVDVASVLPDIRFSTDSSIKRRENLGVPA
jgi:transposase